jgi:hypothetical protein
MQPASRSGQATYAAYEGSSVTLQLGGEWSLVTPLVFKTSDSLNTSGGFDSHPPPPYPSYPTPDLSGIRVSAETILRIWFNFRR